MDIAYRQQSRSRKLLYVGIIVLLFSGLVIYRQVGVVEQSAEQHGISETNIGEVDLGGSTARFMLASFRGPLICTLWWEAIELQIRHEWQQMELLIKSLTKLQPHFRSTWEYQGWNLAYNVSVEFDRVQDKYFYVSQGIQWTANGERINRARVYDPNSRSGKRIIGDPNLRWSVGFFFQDKMTVSDEVNIYRCYLPLSCLQPKDWDPAAFRRNPELLKEFKREHPHLIRRFREMKHIPEEAEGQLDAELLDFLTLVRSPSFPSLYPAQLRGIDDPSAAATEDRSFPVWPRYEEDELLDVAPEKLRQADSLRVALQKKDPQRMMDHDQYQIARLWYDYSLIPMPPPGVEIAELDPESRRLYRTPQRMVSLIFRANPARTKSLQGMQLAKDGWTKESQASWAEALEMWEEYGRANRLDLPPDEMKDLEFRSSRYAERFPELAAQHLEPPRYLWNDQELMGDYLAMKKLVQMERLRGVSNYKHWRLAAEVNSTAEAVEAWKHYFNASYRHRTDLNLALSEYEKAFEIWKKLMVRPRPPHPESDFGALLVLGVGTAPTAFLAQPREYSERTPFGLDNQSQEELGRLQDPFFLHRARCEGPAYLRAGLAAWEVGRLAGCEAAAPAVAVAAFSAIPSVKIPLELPLVEDLLARREGPLDPYFDAINRYRQREYRNRTGLIPRPGAEQPSTPGQPEAVPTAAPTAVPTP